MNTVECQILSNEFRIISEFGSTEPPDSEKFKFEALIIW